MEEINWSLIMWIGGGFASVIVMLTSILVYLIYTDKQDSRENFAKHESWILAQQNEIKELSESTKIAIEHNTTTIELVKELVMGKKTGGQ